MDNIDKKIVFELTENSRISFSEISDKIGLSVSACIERIKKLEATGVIKKYTVILDNSLVGKDVTAYVTVRLDHPKYSDDFIKAATNNHDVTECHYVAGDYDYLLKIVTENIRSLESVIQEIKSLQGVVRTNTTIVLSTIKNEYSCFQNK